VQMSAAISDCTVSMERLAPLCLPAADRMS
jgi:hypothetical protein